MGCHHCDCCCSSPGDDEDEADDDVNGNNEGDDKDDDEEEEKEEEEETDFLRSKGRKQERLSLPPMMSILTSYNFCRCPQFISRKS